MSLYYTECDQAFFDKLFNLGFRTSGGWDYAPNYTAIRLNIKEKTLGGADNGVERYRRHYSDYQYISNQDLLNLIQNKNTMNQKIAIKVETPALSEIVQQFLFTKGFRWNSYGENKVANVKEKYLNLGVGGGKDITHSSYHFKPEEYPLYDAATQFGLLVDLFNQPPKPVIKVKNDAGDEYEAVFDKDYVKFGCAKIHCNCFTELNKVIVNTANNQNSKHFTEIKIGRGLFTPAVIKQIVEHPDFNK